MQKINLKTKPSSGAVIVPLALKLPSMYNNRTAMISHMSGYPTAMYVIGRLQRMIDLSSYNNMMLSLMKVRDISRVTGEVIDTMEGLKVDRYQLNRNDIMTYVAAVTDTMKTYKPSPEDLDLIAHLITSFESNMGSWMLQGGDNEDNLHLKFRGIYQEVLISDKGLGLAAYAPHDDTITTIGELPQFKLTAQEKKANADGTNPDRIKDALVLYKFAATRIVDHVYHLLMDKDIWYKFISPRFKAEVATNLERGKSLKTFALYIQNLMSYNQFFMLETFLYSYDLVQKWITYFPPLEAHTMYRLDNVIRPHDLLNAKHDVEELLGSFVSPKGQNLAGTLIVFPSEMLSSVGMKKSVAQLNEASIKYSTIDPMTDIKNLDRPIYLPLLSGAAAGNFDVAYDITNTLLLGKKVSEEIDQALYGLTPSLIRGSSAATVTALKDLGIKAKLSFSIPHALEYSIEKGVDKGIEGGKLMLDSAAPQFSWRYHDFIRKNVMFTTITDDQIANKYEGFGVSQVIDRDRASAYRSMLDAQFNSLVPSSWGTGTLVYTAATLKSGKEQVRQLIETLTNKNFEIATRELALPHIRKIWATYFSSFALLYVDDAVVNSFEAMPGAWKTPALVEGHGRPYGVSYTNLASRQTPVTKEEDFVKISNGIYLRILNKIPVVTDDLSVDKQFYQEHSSMYFAANSTNQDVEEFVMDSAMLNFALFPVIENTSVPPLVFTSKHAYLTKGLYLNIEMFYRPTAADPAREVTSIGLVHKEWAFERHRYFLEYITFPNYAERTMGLDATMEDDTLVKHAVEKIEKVMTADNKEAAKSVDEAGVASKNAMSKVGEQMNKLSKGHEVADDRPAFLNNKGGGDGKGSSKKHNSKPAKKDFNYKSDKPALKGYPKEEELGMGAEEDLKGKG